MCTNYRGISVIPSIARLFSSILSKKIEKEISSLSEEQSGFRLGRSCLDNIHCLRQIIEKCKSRNVDLYLTFIDLEKAYDSVPRSKLWEAMRRVNIKEKWINIVKKLYKNTEAKIKIGKMVTQNILVNKGLKQGCGLSPILFNIYLEQALHTWYKKCSGMGIEIGDDNLHSLLYADDQILITQDEEDNEYMLRKLKEEYNRWGLDINFNKTECMCIGRTLMDITIDGDKIKSCNNFKYLGSIISNTGTCDEDINSRIIMGKKATKALHSVIWNSNIRQEIKKRIFHTVVENIVLYGGEMWPQTKKSETKYERWKWTI